MRMNSYKLSKLCDKFEDGEIEEDEEILLFQYLVDTGLAWKFQGTYGRYAERMLEAGLVKG